MEYKTPVGLINVEAYNGFIVELSFVGGIKVPPFRPKNELKEQTQIKHKNEEALAECFKQLDDYFAGNLKEFTVPILMNGTPFRMLVWKALQGIPYGETISYKELAIRIGNPLAIRAVGGANHHNPISIIVPCHRVIGANGKLVGFGGGMDKKEILLNHEKMSKI